MAKRRGKMNLLITSILFARLKFIWSGMQKSPDWILIKILKILKISKNEQKATKKAVLCTISAKNLWQTSRNGRGLISSDSTQRGSCSMKNGSFRCLQVFILNQYSLRRLPRTYKLCALVRAKLKWIFKTPLPCISHSLRSRSNRSDGPVF